MTQHAPHCEIQYMTSASAVARPARATSQTILSIVKLSHILRRGGSVPVGECARRSLPERCPAGPLRSPRGISHEQYKGIVAHIYSEKTSQEAGAQHEQPARVPLQLSDWPPVYQPPARGARTPPRVGSPILLREFGGQSPCTEYYEDNHQSLRKCRDAPCRGGTFLSRRRRGHGGHGTVSPQRQQRNLPPLRARMSAPLSVGWLASSSRRRSSWPCLSRGCLQNPNPAPNRAGSPIIINN